METSQGSQLVPLDSTHLVAESGTTQNQHTLVAGSGTTQHILSGQTNVSHLVTQTRTSHHLVSNQNTTGHLVSESVTPHPPMVAESSRTLPMIPGSLEGGTIQVSTEGELQTLTPLEPIGATLTVSDSGELTLCTVPKAESDASYSNIV